MLIKPYLHSPDLLGLILEASEFGSVICHHLLEAQLDVNEAV
jgi:hypothetical protein